jgi:hypothetical protein
MFAKTLFFLRPKFIKLVILIIITLLASIAVTEYKETSKVTWEESRGVPWSFLTVIGYHGPCYQLEYCRKVHIQTLRPLELLVDILVWYIVSCILFSVYKRIAQHWSCRFLDNKVQKQRMGDKK